MAASHCAAYSWPVMCRKYWIQEAYAWLEYVGRGGVARSHRESVRRSARRTWTWSLGPDFLGHTKMMGRAVMIMVSRCRGRPRGSAGDTGKIRWHHDAVTRLGSTWLYRFLGLKMSPTKRLNNASPKSMPEAMWRQAYWRRERILLASWFSLSARLELDRNKSTCSSFWWQSNSAPQN
jgi:hypothetical protein